MRPIMPKLTPLVRLDRLGGSHLIPVHELAAQIEEMERYGCWALQQGVIIADQILEPGDPEATVINERLMGRYFGTAGAVLGAINGRANGFKFLLEVRDGNYTGGDPEGYRRAKG